MPMPAWHGARGCYVFEFDEVNNGRAFAKALSANDRNATFVMPGLAPGIQCSHLRCLEESWIAGSSPAMTKIEPVWLPC